jgi:NhaP-type Na+/H+ or K+/H+ antiporter
MIGVDIELLILAVGALVVATPLASKLGLPYPVLLTIVGVGAALVPGMPEVVINPNIILPILLPPLLWTAATRTSWTHIRANLRPIFMLAVALVVVSAFAVAVLLAWLIPEVPWAIAFALGAACAPPDPLAATSVAGQLGLPHRMVVVIEGEGLQRRYSADAVQYGVGRGGCRRVGLIYERRLAVPDRVGARHRRWATPRTYRPQGA